PAGLTHPMGRQIEADLGTLAPQESRKETLTTTAVQAGRQVNRMTVTVGDAVKGEGQAEVLVTAPGGGPASRAGAGPASRAGPGPARLAGPTPGLEVRQSGPRRCFPDRPADYVIDVYNTGKEEALNVRVSDILPPGMEFVAASEGGVYDPASRAVSWVLASVPAGQKRGVLLKLRTRAAGAQVNRVLVRPEGGEEVRSQLAIQVAAMPPFRL